MKRLFIITTLTILALSTAAAQPRAVFMGDSIFDCWDSPKHGGHPEFFTDNDFVNCGISGQVTAQMLERFERDVVERKPTMVVLCCGTNDIAQNKGYVPNRQIMRNIKTMVRTAERNGIKAAICTILPAARYRWRPEVEPVELIRDMNRRIKCFARGKSRIYIDLYTPLAAPDGSLPQTLSKDGVHPNSDCYTIMERVVLEAIQ